MKPFRVIRGGGESTCGPTGLDKIREVRPHRPATVPGLIVGDHDTSYDLGLLTARSMRPRKITKVDLKRKGFRNFELEIRIEYWRFRMFEGFLKFATYLQCDEVRMPVGVISCNEVGNEATIIVRPKSWSIKAHLAMQRIADKFERTIDYKPSRLVLIDSEIRTVADFISQ